MVRWSRRKHRPRGSLLRRPCRCAQVGPQFCAAHRLGAVGAVSSWTEAVVILNFQRLWGVAKAAVSPRRPRRKAVYVE
eukprot:314426-Pyramimonas_sp.AAC.1